MNYIILIVILYINLNIIRALLSRYKIFRDIKNKNYFLKYQPIVNCNSESIVAFEALLRTQKNFRSNSIPNIISNIEKNNMMTYYSLWLIKQAILDYSKISSQHKTTNMYISINISIKEIENKKLVDKFIIEINKSNLPKNKICLEITEKHKFSDINSARDSIKRLREAGYLIAIDDFGVDYSNFEILSNIDFDIIKIDKCFVDNLIHSKINRQIIKSVSDMYLEENKAIVIEGVENLEQNTILASMNNSNICIQGYFYYKPLNLKQVYNLPYGLNFREW